MSYGIVLGNILLNLASGYSISAAVDIPTIYAGMTLPPLSPPTYIFPIIWAILYILLPCSLVHLNQNATILYYVIIGLQFIWIPVFFVFELKYLAAGIIQLLIILSIILCIMNKNVLVFFVPFIGWLCFALYLNAFSFFP